MKCKKCENIERDPLTGMLMCLTCGSVVEESTIVQGIEFDGNQNATGTFVDSSKPTYFASAGRNTLSQMIDPTQIRLNKVSKYMYEIGTILTIPENIINLAKKLYNIASNKKFTQGRKTKQIVGAILYLACRMGETKHLLIDFSEVIQVNLFIIGSAYLKLVKLLNIETKITDPSLYMCRFCQKIDFGKKNREIENTALKILQFLKRDWITTGRRPTGLCGACILISAKLHGFEVTIDKVASAVHVCNDTIKKRINEFSLTKVASMTKEEFENFEKSHFYLGQPPPAFTRNRKKEEQEKLENPEMKEEATEEFLEPLPVTKAPAPQETEEFLSSLGEKEEAKYLYNESEYVIRKNIWEIMYKDWLEEQREKKAIESHSSNQKKPRQRKLSSQVQDKGQSPYEAIKNSSKFGKKINYNYVKTLFEKEKSQNII